MPLAINNVNTLQDYLKGVLGKAEHHAPGVSEVIFPLLGLILWKADADKDIEVFAVVGEMKNVLWVWINGKRYAFSYNHNADKIEMRVGTTHGNTLMSFSNGDTTKSMISFFEQL